MQNNFAKLSPEDLKIISEAQEKLNQSSGKAVALVAYEVQVQFITVTHKNTLLTGLSSKEGTYQLSDERGGFSRLWHRGALLCGLWPFRIALEMRKKHCAGD